MCLFHGVSPWWILLVVVLSLAWALLASIKPTNFTMIGTHVAITGGSSGIGFAVAKESIRRGASHVTIIARNESKLKAAAKRLQALCKDGQTVHTVSVDVSANFEDVESAFEGLVKDAGTVVDVLVNCAGISHAGAFDAVDVGEFERMLKINVLGSMYPTRSVVGGMKRKGCGRIVFVSSQAGQVGLYGYTGYSSSKFALRGLAESLQMELRPHNIFVSVAFPPDTDTPGFEAENADKPHETRLISETAGLFKPEVVAKDIVNGIVSGRFSVYSGLDGFMLANLSCGMAPISVPSEALLQVATASLFRFVSLFYLWSFDRICAKTQRDRRQSKDKDT